MTAPRVIVVGLGPMGQRHIAAWTALWGPTSVAAVVRGPADRTRAAHIADALGLPSLPCVDPLAATRAGPGQPQWASVCTPTRTHADVALPLLAAGLHVLVEKPLAHDTVRAQALVDASDGRCFVAHTCRAESPAIASLQRWGDRRAARARVRRFERARPLPPGTPTFAAMGQLFDVLVHDLASVHEVLPSGPASRVTATWDPVSKALRSELWWGDRQLTIEQHRAAAEGRRDVCLWADKDAAGWSLGPGSRRAWLQEGGGDEEELPLYWREPTEALVAEVLRDAPLGAASRFSAQVGFTVMQRAAAVLSALPAEALGAAFSWEHVR